MQVAVVAVVVVGCALLAYGYASRQATDAARDKVVAIAHTLADSPLVRNAARTPDPTGTLQPYALRVTHDTGVDFITIMNPAGIRWTHPNPAEIGKHFLGDTGPALRGHTFTQTYTGTLGASVRVVTPVEDGGRITALVSVGITVSTISGEVRRDLAALVAVAALALAVGGAGSYAVNRRLRRYTHGMGPEGLSRMYDYHEATLHAVGEGLILLDAGHEVALCNDAARDLLDLPADVVGRDVAGLGLPASLTGALLDEDGPRRDELHLAARRIVAVNTRPVRGGERRGTVVTLRDHTEIQALAGELDSERGFTEALRSQAHEAANRLHTVVSLIALDREQEAVEFATAELELSQALTDQVVAACAEPVLAALLLGKAAEASERGVAFRVTDDSRIDDGVLPPRMDRRDLVTILGNLIDNALDAAVGASADHAPSVRVTARVEGGELLLRVADSGPGVAPEALAEVFRRGWSTKGSAGAGRAGARAGAGGRGLGLALVEQAARRCGGTVRVEPGAGAVFTVTLPVREGIGS